LDFVALDLPAATLRLGRSLAGIKGGIERAVDLDRVEPG
jgi:hypothetical protein